MPVLAQRSHATISGSGADAGVTVQPGVLGVSLPTAAAGAPRVRPRSRGGAAAAADVGPEAGATAYAVVAARAGGRERGSDGGGAETEPEAGSRCHRVVLSFAGQPAGGSMRKTVIMPPKAAP